MPTDTQPSESSRISLQNETVLAECEPIYETLEGWNEPIDQLRRFEELPVAAQTFLRRLEEHSKVKLVGIGCGPKAEDQIDVTQ